MHANDDGAKTFFSTLVGDPTTLGDAELGEGLADALGQGALPELTTEFESQDATGNLYRIVVRYDASIADKVASFPGNVTVISSPTEAAEKGYPAEELAAAKASGQLRDHASLDRIPGSYHIMAHPIASAPEPLGVAVRNSFSTRRHATTSEEGKVTAQLAFETCEETWGGGCVSANSITFYMESYLVSGSSNKGYLQAYRDHGGTCATTPYTKVNETAYETTQYEQFPENDFVGAMFTGGWFFVLIDPDSSSHDDCMEGDMTYQVWF